MNAENWNPGNRKEQDSEDKVKRGPSEKPAVAHTQAENESSGGHAPDSHFHQAQSRVTAEFKPKTKFLATPASMKPRRKKKGKTWLFISAAVLIIAISAVATFLVMNRSEEQEFQEALERIDAALPIEVEQSDTPGGHEVIDVPFSPDRAAVEADGDNKKAGPQDLSVLPAQKDIPVLGKPAEPEQLPAPVGQDTTQPAAEETRLFVTVLDREDLKTEAVEQPASADHEGQSNHAAEPADNIGKPQMQADAAHEKYIQTDMSGQAEGGEVEIQKSPLQETVMPDLANEEAVPQVKEGALRDKPVEGPTREHAVQNDAAAKDGLQQQDAAVFNPEAALVVASAENTLQKTLAPPASELEIITAVDEEKFDSNENNWDVFDSAEASAKVIGGGYYLEHKRQAGSRIILYDGQLPRDRDFITEVSMEHIMSSGPFSYGFIFGAKDVLNNYSFQIVGNGMYSVRKDTDGVSRELAGGNIMGVEIRTDAPNVIKVLRQGSNVYFFVNGHFIHGVAHMTFFGDRIGFILSGKMKAAVDWIRTEIGK